MRLISPGPTQCASLCETPGVNSPGHRTAARLTVRQTTTPACSRESDGMREAQPAQFAAQKSQQHLGGPGADYTRTAAVRRCVYASLAPAQPPPAAGLASGLTCRVLSADRGTRFLWGPFLGPQIGRWLGTHSTPGTIVRQRPKRRLEYYMHDTRAASADRTFLVQQEGVNFRSETSLVRISRILNSLTFSFPLFPVL
jgi:hypothetical protein